MANSGVDIISDDGGFKLRLGEVTLPMLEAEARRVQRRFAESGLTPFQRDLQSSGPRFGFFLSRDF